MVSYNNLEPIKIKGCFFQKQILYGAITVCVQYVVMPFSSLFRIEKITENTPPREVNNISNHRVLIKPEAQNNQKNKEVSKNEEKKALEAEKYGFQKVGQDKPLTKINSVKLNSEYRTLPVSTLQAGHYRPVHLNGSENKAVNIVPDTGDGGQHNAVHPHMVESERVIQRTNSMLQLEQWIKIQRGKGQDEETRG